MKNLLTEKGGNFWQGGDKERVYLSRAMVNKMLGLKVSTYNSGKIASATLDSEGISNGCAASLIEATDKVFYDVAAEKFTIQIGWGSPETRKRAESLENRFNRLTIDEVASKL